MQLNNFLIPGNNLVVKGNLEFRTEDIAGETSGTDSVEKGIKPKILRISVTIPFKMSQSLSDLIKTAEALDSSGERKIYTITDRTANAAGIRQVKFTDHFNWNEARTLQVWHVAFTLQEYLSNPERVEKREQDKTIKGKTPATDTTQYKQVLDQAKNL